MNIAENNRLLLDCYLSGRVPPHEWNEHLKDPVFAKFANEKGYGAVGAAGHVREPQPTLSARERAFQGFMAGRAGRETLARPRDHTNIIAIAHDLFKAGWNARKQTDLEVAYGLKLLALPLEDHQVRRPLHSSAYEPLTPFKP